MRTFAMILVSLTAVSSFAQTPMPPPRTGPMPGPSNGAIEVPVTRNESLVLQVPEKIRYSNIEANSDRTVTIYNPKVYRVGAWRRINYDTSNEHGICGLVSRGMTMVDRETTNVPAERMVSINNNGAVSAFGIGNRTYSWIICKKEQSVGRRGSNGGFAETIFGANP